MVESMDSGLEAYVEIRRRFPKLPMIFMTSLGEEIRPYFTGHIRRMDINRGKTSGPDEFLIDCS